MVKLSTPFSKYLERNLPKKWTKRIERYSANKLFWSESNWQIVLRAYLLQVIIHSTIIVSIILLSSTYVLPKRLKIRPCNCVALLTLIIISPFICAVFAQSCNWSGKWTFKTEKISRSNFMMVFLRAILTLVFLGFY
jgi:CPA2 family monovalent cation:H+ antiporter-2